MLSTTRILLICIAISLIIISCQNERRIDSKITDTLAVQPNDTIIPVIQPRRLNFDTALFKTAFDSLLSAILNEKIYTSLVIDTTENVAGSIYPFIDSSIYTIKYRFKAPRPHGFFSITVYESFFKDSITTNRIFKITRAAGGREGLKSHQVPGLSYEFDYLIKYKDKMIDLNAPCTYADKAYRKLLPIFKRTFKNEYLKDTIACKCGWFCE